MIVVLYIWVTVFTVLYGHFFLISSYFFYHIIGPLKITSKDSVPRTLGRVSTWPLSADIRPGTGQSVSVTGLPRSSVCRVRSSLGPTLPLSFPTFPWLPP